MKQFKHGELVWYKDTKIMIVAEFRGNIILVNVKDFATLDDIESTRDYYELLRRSVAISYKEGLDAYVGDFANNNVVQAGFSICKK